VTQLLNRLSGARKSVDGDKGDRRKISVRGGGTSGDPDQKIEKQAGIRHNQEAAALTCHG